MKKVKLLFKDSSHPSNRDIIAFLTMNLDKLNQVGILVDLRIVVDSELPSLRKRGVTKLPILVVGGKKIYERSTEIKDALTQMYKHNGHMSGPEASKKYESGDPDEQIREYMESDLSMDAYYDDDGDGDGDTNHMDKVLAMAAERTKARLDKGGDKYERPGARGSRKREKSSSGKHRKHRREPQSSSSSGSGSYIERNQSAISGGAGSRRSKPGGSGGVTRDDQLMMEKFNETGIDMDL